MRARMRGLVHLGLALGLLVAAPGWAQAQATAVTGGGTLPAECVGGRNVYIKTGDDAGLYACLTDDVWTNVANGSGTTRTVGITIDGGGAAITTGVKGFIQFPSSGTITKATLLSTDASATAGSIVIDIWKDTFANYPPTDDDSITASAPPTLSTASKSEDSTLTGWTTSVTAGDVFGFNVDSATTVTRVTLTIEIQE